MAATGHARRAPTSGHLPPKRSLGTGCPRPPEAPRPSLVVLPRRSSPERAAPPPHPCPTPSTHHGPPPTPPNTSQGSPWLPLASSPPSPRRRRARSPDVGLKPPPAMASDRWLSFYLFDETCRLHNNSKKNPKNTKLVLFECLDPNLHGKNINSCEMTLFASVKIYVVFRLV